MDEKEGAMEIRVNGSRVVLVEGDITNEDTDAIVNAANSRLAGGGGVDGAIHRAGGPAVMAECRKIGGCPTGKAVLTTAGNLKARCVIHAVGPVYRDGKSGEAALLESAYRESLKLASAHGIKSIAFPALSTGAYGYPLEEAARIALRTTVDYLKEHQDVELVRFVLFGRQTYDVFAKVLKELAAEGKG
jgi:O-acetyl-ADP-ribose deacetylase (regulator of RNase III)